MKFPTNIIALATLTGVVTASPVGRLNATTTCPNVLSCSSAAQSAGSCCSPTYGLLVLVQQWIVGYGPSNAFTLHGLWPDTCSGGQGPSNGCDTSRSYSSIGSILQSNAPSTYNEANTYWPSDQGDNSVFWTHEWDKHGTCVSTLAPSCFSNPQQYQDVTTYFQTVLDLRAKYDLYSALNSAGITPGGSADVNSFSSAIQSAYGVTPKVDCTSGVLSEVWIYFNVQGPSTYVPTDAKASGSCSGSFSYPNKGTSPVTTSSTKTPTSTSKTSTSTSKVTTTTTKDSTTTTTKTTSTKVKTTSTKTTPSPTQTSLGSCSWEGDQYCLSSDGQSSEYKQCDNDEYILYNCPSGQACYQDYKYNIDCY